MERPHDDPLTRARRRTRECSTPLAEHRRVLLVGPDEAWRLLTAYEFEEAGYMVYAAADQRQAVAFTTRLLPDVVVVAIDTPETLEILVRLSTDSSTRDIPVVVLTTSLHSTDARCTREAGGVTLLPHAAEHEVLVGDVEALIAAAPRARRTLKRRLLDIQELARFYTPDDAGQTRLRALIDRLQVAIFAVNTEGHCLAASQGAMRLTGYSRRQLVSPAVVDARVAGGPVFHDRWPGLLAPQDEADTTTIITQAGEGLAVHAATLTNVLPGVHIVALATT